MNRRRDAVAIAAGAAVGTYLGLQWLGRNYGATRSERRERLAGDELQPDPMAVTTHAITIDAPPARVWPWLVQMGWHRGAWYTSRWVDRLLFPNNEPSAERLLPNLQQLAIGDQIPDGPPEADCYFVVSQLVPDRALVLHSTKHLPPRWERRFGAWIDWTWAFILRDLGAGGTRFIFRSRMRAGPWWVKAVYLGVIVPADFVMARQMLRGVRIRAERTSVEDLAPLHNDDAHGRLEHALGIVSAAPSSGSRGDAGRTVLRPAGEKQASFVRGCRTSRRARRGNRVPASPASGA